MKNFGVSLDFLTFPQKNTCDGENLSPGITLKGLDARSVAIIIFNPFEKSCCSFISWIIWNIPPLVIIHEGIPPAGIVTCSCPAGY